MICIIKKVELLVNNAEPLRAFFQRHFGPSMYDVYIGTSDRSVYRIYQ